LPDCDVDVLGCVVVAVNGGSLRLDRTRPAGLARRRERLDPDQVQAMLDSLEML